MIVGSFINIICLNTFGVLGLSGFLSAVEKSPERRRIDGDGRVDILNFLKALNKVFYQIWVLTKRELDLSQINDELKLLLVIFSKVQIVKNFGSHIFEGFVNRFLNKFLGTFDKRRLFCENFNLNWTKMTLEWALQID